MECEGCHFCTPPLVQVSQNSLVSSSMEMILGTPGMLGRWRGMMRMYLELHGPVLVSLDMSGRGERRQNNLMSKVIILALFISASHSSSLSLLPCLSSLPLSLYIPISSSFLSLYLLLSPPPSLPSLLPPLPSFLLSPPSSLLSQHAGYSEPRSCCVLYRDRGDSGQEWLPHTRGVLPDLSLCRTHCRLGVVQ